MALIKSQTLDTGVNAEYWRVNKITADRRENIYLIEVALYISKAFRDAGKAPVYVSSFYTGNHDIVDGDSCATAEAYSYLKLLPEFTGATDA